MANRAHYEQRAIRNILDAGLIAHVGVQTSDGPLVLPMAYGCDNTMLYLHGAAANHLLGSAAGHDICASVTLLDGLVMARTPFHNSMNYRSVVVRGLATQITDPAATLQALRIITGHVVPNWDVGRPVSPTDNRKTLVLQMPLAEASAKVRTGDPVDEEHDVEGPWWAGVIPLETRFLTPRMAADCANPRPIPAHSLALEGTRTDER